jgi:hypothetical protein
MKNFKYFLLLLISFPALSQDANYFNTRKIFKEQKVKERTTIDVLDHAAKISIDGYDNSGNKIKAVEIYKGDRKLKKFSYEKHDWIGINTTTTFEFVYDSAGNQTVQIDEDYHPVDDHEMYCYDKFGNIIRWEDGRTFQPSYMKSRTYDKLGNILQENEYYWEHPYDKKISDSTLESTATKFYLKYDARGNVIESLANYPDRMSGQKWEYTCDNSGKILEKKQYRVWSYFGLDHEIPTSKDIDRTSLDCSWNYSYDVKGNLLKEERKDYDDDSTFSLTTYFYNEFGLWKTKSNEGKITDYFYNEKGLLTEMKTYDAFRNKMTADLRYEYAFW